MHLGQEVRPVEHHHVEGREVGVYGIGLDMSCAIGRAAFGVGGILVLLSSTIKLDIRCLSLRGRRNGFSLRLDIGVVHGGGGQRFGKGGFEVVQEDSIEQFVEGGIVVGRPEGHDTGDGRDSWIRVGHRDRALDSRGLTMRRNGYRRGFYDFADRLHRDVVELGMKSRQKDGTGSQSLQR
jgi:hypothetical protein